MEMCYLRGDCRSGDIGEPGIDKNGPDAKHEKQEKMRGLIWGILLIPKNIIWFSARESLMGRKEGTSIYIVQDYFS
jgi:hypothetical protein